MTDKELIDKLNAIVGQSITDISYTPTKFYHSTPTTANGNWTNVNPDLFVLHSPEWQFRFSDGLTLYFSAEQLTEDNFASKFVIRDTTITSKDEIILKIPKEFKWTDIFGRPIKKFRLWQRLFSSSKLFGQEFNFKYQDHYQIIELLCGDKLLAITTMNGDLGDSTFYPTGYLGDRLGLYINKTICTSHTAYDVTMRMALTHKSE